MYILYTRSPPPHTHLRPSGCAPGLRGVSIKGAPVEDTIMREVGSVLSTPNTPDPPLQYKWRSSAARVIGGSPGEGEKVNIKSQHTRLKKDASEQTKLSYHGWRLYID